MVQRFKYQSYSVAELCNKIYFALVSTGYNCFDYYTLVAQIFKVSAELQSYINFF